MGSKRYRNCLSNGIVDSSADVAVRERMRPMKRRNIKFVAGSLQLSPDRVEVAFTPRKGPAGPRRRRPEPAGSNAPAAARTATRKRR